MKFIKTSNQIIELVETDKQNNVISSNGFQLGELYFQIKNKKVSFYLNDSEKPFDSFVWSIDLPITIDGETYATEDEASAALSKIMVLEDINELKERLDAEILRSTNEDTKHDVQISGLTDDIADLDDRLADEIQDRISGDSVLNDKINAEKERAIQKENAILNKVNLNTERISGLSDALDVEIQNRIAGDAQLQNVISIESEDRRHADVILMNLISGLTDDLNDEIVRSTAKDAEHDALISGLTDDLNVEIQNRIAGDTHLQNVIGIESEDRRHADVILKDLIDTVNADLNAEIQNIINDESGLSETLTNEIIRSTNKDQEHDDLISGLTDDIAVLDEEKQDKLYAGKYITINGNNISADSNHVYRLTQQAYDNLPDIDVEGLYIITDAPDVDLDVYAPLSALTAEIDRSTAKDNEHDAAISGLTDMVDVLSGDTTQVQQNLEAEIARATAREDDIAEDLEDEFHRAQSAEHLLEDKITTERERAIDVENDLAEQISAITAVTSGVTNVDIANENEEIKINVTKVGGNTSERILKAGYGIKIDENGVISLDVTISGNTLIIN